MEQETEQLKREIATLRQELQELKQFHEQAWQIKQKVKREPFTTTIRSDVLSEMRMIALKHHRSIASIIEESCIGWLDRHNYAVKSAGNGS